MALKVDEDIDSKNRSQADYDEKFNKIRKAEEGSSFNDIANNFDKTADSSDEDGNIQKLRDKESTGDWKTSVDKSGAKTGGKLSGLKKKGPIGVIIAIIVGGVGFGGMFSGANLLVNLKEQLAGNIMDSSASVFHVKGNQLLSTKLSDMTSGSCSVVTIRCKFKTMSDRQIKKLERAGITVNKSTSVIPGRSKVVNLEFDGDTIDAKNIRAISRSNPKFASALTKAFNPRLAAWANSAAEKAYGRIGMKRTKNLEPSVDKNKMRTSLKENVAGKAAAMETARLRTITGSDGNPALDDDGNQRYMDADGKEVSADEAERRMTAADSDYKNAVEAKKAVAGNASPAKVAGSALKGGLLVGTGIVDSACTGWMIVRTAGFAAKYLGALQLIRYANVFLNTADAIKAGDATPEEVAYLGEIIMSQNAQGKTGMDSRGWNYAAYGDIAPIPTLGGDVASAVGTDSTVDVSGVPDSVFDNEALKAEVTDYISGEITSDSLMAEIAKAAGQGGAATDVIDGACGFVKSGWGQAGIITVGVAALVGCAVGVILAGAGAACLGANAVAAAAISVTIGITISILSPWLISLAADEIITGFENGNQAMNAVVSGAGAMNTQVGLGNGLGYMDATTAAEFAQVRDDSRDYFAMVDRENHSPFDSTNVNTFMGSLTSNLFPYVIKMSSLSSGISSVLSLSANTIMSPLKNTVKAKSYGDAGVCGDRDYADAGIATDINCNPLVGQANDTLSIDVDTVLDYMISGGYIDEISGKPSRDDKKFSEWITSCVEKSSAFGSFAEGEIPSAATSGEICMEGYGGDSVEVTRYKMFRAYQSFFLVNEVMDDEKPPQTSQPSVGRPDNVQDAHEGWTTTPNQDYSDIACDSRSTDKGITTATDGAKIRLCEVHDSSKYPAYRGSGEHYVSSLISTNLINMFEASYADGITLGISSGYRSDSTTQHGRGIAVDLGSPGGSSICYTSTHTPANTKRVWEGCFTRTDTSGKAFAWLNDNAEKYGFYNLDGDEGSSLYEAWHWSTSGK